MSLKDVITILISGFALLLSLTTFILTQKKVKSEALIAYLKDADSESMREMRTKLYESKTKLEQEEYQENIKQYYKNRTVNASANIDEIRALEKNITDHIAFYDKWALLSNRHYLPRWAIDKFRAAVFIKVYKIVQFYLDFRQKENDKYAYDMKKLYERLEKKKGKSRNAAE